MCVCLCVCVCVCAFVCVCVCEWGGGGGVHPHVPHSANELRQEQRQESGLLADGGEAVIAVCAHGRGAHGQCQGPRQHSMWHNLSGLGGEGRRRPRRGGWQECGGTHSSGATSPSVCSSSAGSRPRSCRAPGQGCLGSGPAPCRRQ